MTAPDIFSLLQLESVDDLPDPDNGPYYVATRKGYMVMQRSHFGNTLTPIDAIDTLPDTPSIIWKDIPKLPAELVGQVWSFFRAVLETKGSEAMVDITWSEEKGYRVFVPPQEASHGGVKAQRNLSHYKGQMVGTIHSHCDFSAFHSPTDRHDADQHNGLHITLGMVNHDTPEIAIMISQNGEKWDPIPYDEAIDGMLTLNPHPQWWENFVSKPKPNVASIVAYKGKPWKPAATNPFQPKPNGHAPTNNQGYGTLLGAAVNSGIASKYNDDLGDIEWEIDKLAQALEMLGIEVQVRYFPIAPTGIITDDDDNSYLPTTIFGS